MLNLSLKIMARYTKAENCPQFHLSVERSNLHISSVYTEQENELRFSRFNEFSTRRTTCPASVLSFFYSSWRICINDCVKLMIAAMLVWTKRLRNNFQLPLPVVLCSTRIEKLSSNISELVRHPPSQRISSHRRSLLRYTINLKERKKKKKKKKK